jgi:hypothetical protein
MNARVPGFLGQNCVVGNQFPKFSEIDKVSNASREELIDLLSGLDRVFVSPVFAGQKLVRHYPVGVPIRPRRNTCGYFAKARRVRVIAHSGARGMGFQSPEIALLLFTLETTKLARANRSVLYFFQHHKLAPEYGRMKGCRHTLFDRSSRR